jgi:hypothetical protein
MACGLCYAAKRSLAKDKIGSRGGRANPGNGLLSSSWARRIALFDASFVTGACLFADGGETAMGSNRPMKPSGN